MESLAQSLTKARDKIKRDKTVWVKGIGGKWSKSNDEDVVGFKIWTMNKQIAILEKKYGLIKSQ